MNSRAQASWWRPPLPERDMAVETAQGAALPFWALMAFTLVLLLSPQAFVPALVPLHLAFLSAALAGGAYVAGQLLRRQRVLRLTQDMMLALALAGWSLVTMPLSYWPGEACRSSSRSISRPWWSIGCSPESWTACRASRPSPGSSA